MKRLSLCLILSVILILGGTAFAAPPQLKGNYAFTGEASCLNSTLGFDTDLKPNLNGDVYSNSFSVQGIRTFNGDGTGTVTGTSISTSPPPKILGFFCSSCGFAHIHISVHLRC
jgi:hypothetical protein